MRANHVHYAPPVDTGPDLFTPPHVAVDTSLQAAAKIAGHTQRIREAIYLFIRASGGATAGEITEKLGLNPSTVRPRLRELEGTAPWCRGKLPRRIQRTDAVRQHMHVYEVMRDLKG